jgi:hypothetical protein
MTPTLGRPRSENIVQSDFPDDGFKGDEHRYQFPCGCELVVREADNDEGWAYAVDLCSPHRSGGARP